MRNLPPPSRASDRADLTTAVRRYRYAGVERGHQITEEEIGQVVALYDLYEADRGTACEELKGEGLPQTLRDTIQAGYEKTRHGRSLDALREHLFQNVDLCPVCGIGAAVELDHHLPQSVFKPLAIHSRNLVPMCHACNHIKLAGFGEEGVAGFLHPYYDVLPDIDFLLASVCIEDNSLVVAFAINAAAALPAGYADRLTNQFETLHLNDRYQQEIITYVASHAASLHLSFRQMGQEGVRALLNLQARYESGAFHRNHWRPVLLRSLAAFDEFTDGGFGTVLPMPEDMLEDLES